MIEVSDNRAGDAAAKRPLVLIVEDTDAHALLAAQVLKTGGFASVRAASAEQAFEMIAAGTAPDLVLMDMVLPGVSGIAAILRWRESEATRTLPVIAVTSHRYEFPETDLARAGADGYIAKPYHYADLIEMVRAVLARRR